MKTLKASLASVFLIVGASAALAQTPGACQLRIAAGPQGKVYERLVADVAAVCGNVVPTCAVLSKGGLENLTRLSASEADLGLVQVDTLKEMVPTDSQIGELQLVLPMHNNLLHVLALRKGSKLPKKVGGIEIPGLYSTVRLQRVSELKGLTVAVVGSAQLLGQTLNRDYGQSLSLQMADSDEQAVRMLKSGEVQAIFTLGGWPLPSVRAHGVDSGLSLLDFDLEVRQPYRTERKNYPNLDAMNLNFLAVANVLVTRPFKPEGEKGRQVAALRQCLTHHMDELQEGRYQPGWREIKDTSVTYGLPRMPMAGSKATASRP